MRQPARTALVSATANQLAVRALDSMWRRRTRAAGEPSAQENQYG
jgi:hypothetical protein